MDIENVASQASTNYEFWISFVALAVAVISAFFAWTSWRTATKANALAAEANDLARQANDQAKRANDIASSFKWDLRLAPMLFVDSANYTWLLDGVGTYEPTKIKVSFAFDPAEVLHESIEFPRYKPNAEPIKIRAKYGAKEYRVAIRKLDGCTVTWEDLQGVQQTQTIPRLPFDAPRLYPESEGYAEAYFEYRRLNPERFEDSSERFEDSSELGEETTTRPPEA